MFFVKHTELVQAENSAISKLSIVITDTKTVEPLIGYHSPQTEATDTNTVEPLINKRSLLTERPPLFSSHFFTFFFGGKVGVGVGGKWSLSSCKNESLAKVQPTFYGDLFWTFCLTSQRKWEVLKPRPWTSPYICLSVSWCFEPSQPQRIISGPISPCIIEQLLISNAYRQHIHEFVTKTF